MRNLTIMLAIAATAIFSAALAYWGAKINMLYNRLGGRKKPLLPHIV